jgi:hypothetical protein
MRALALVHCGADGAKVVVGLHAQRVEAVDQITRGIKQK